MRITVIGSSTGGPYILEKIFSKFPVVRGVIILVQHLPHSFTPAFRNHISVLTNMNVIIPQSGHHIHEKEIIVAPAGQHLILEQNRTIVFTNGEKKHGVRPAVDCTMLSLVQQREDSLMGVILTGMGQDGAEGIVHIRNLGGHTIVQDPASCPIRSMPQAAIDTGKVNEILTPEKIREALIIFGSG
jgi:two-component system chemotaxis response regulator CheB